MKPESKPYNENLASIAAVFLLCFSMLSSCGLGTEVGNGFKDEGESKKKGTNASSSEKVQEDGTKTDPMKGEGAPEIPDVDYSILLNSCGSPFEPIYQTPFVLSGTAKSDIAVEIRGAYDLTLGVLTVSNKTGKFLANIQDDEENGDHKVLVTDENYLGMASNYSCSDVQEVDENNYHTYSVVLTPLYKNDNPVTNAIGSTLTWVVDKTQSPPKLILITVSSDEIELLKLEAYQD